MVNWWETLRRLSQNLSKADKFIQSRYIPYEIEADWDQVHLLPACIEDCIGAEHPARFIREFIEGLDLSALGFAVSSGATEGKPWYTARFMLRVWLFGLLLEGSLNSSHGACLP